MWFQLIHTPSPRVLRVLAKEVDKQRSLAERVVPLQLALHSRLPPLWEQKFLDVASSELKLYEAVESRQVSLLFEIAFRGEKENEV